MRDSMLEAGSQLINEHGFAGVGLMKIINQAGGTKGSFYHYFKSKEHFGEILLADYFERHLDILNSFILDPSLPRAARIEAYFQHWSDTKLTADFSINCLAVKLSGEIPGTSEAMRSIMAAGSEQMIVAMAELFIAGNRDGDFTIEQPKSLASTLYSLWLGSTLMAAMQQDRSLLEHAMTQTRQFMA